MGDGGILKTIKRHLGIHEEDPSFDLEIINDINMSLNVLTQLGVGPKNGFQVTGDSETWYDFLGDDVRLNMVIPYIFRKTQMLFDPPTSGIMMDSVKSQIDEMETRLLITVELEIPEVENDDE